MPQSSSLTRRTRALYALLALVTLATSSAHAGLQIPFLEKSQEAVTYGSALKLAHAPTAYQLNSQDVRYGTGSGQRSVTGLDKKAGAAGYWVVYAPVSSPLTSADPTPQRGDKVPCGAVVRLQHPESTTFLHSHRFQSPISNQQEVSAFDGQDEGDNWVIECAQGTQYWSREKRVALRHQVTNYYLAADSQYKYNSPIPGQLEIFGQPRSNDNSQWMAQEGFYMQARE